MGRGGERKRGEEKRALPCASKIRGRCLVFLPVGEKEVHLEIKKTKERGQAP